VEKAIGKLKMKMGLYIISVKLVKKLWLIQ
jgi:hypothetical protein